MTSNVKVLSTCKREIEVDISTNEVMREFERIVTQYSSGAKIPGFRPGKAPIPIIKQRFYPEIRDNVINSLVPKALSHELKVQNLDPVAMPVVSDLHFKEGDPLHFKAQFEIMPEIKLPEYKKIKVKKKNTSLTDKELQQALEELRQRSAEYAPVEGRGVVDGDYVIAEVRGKDLKTKKMLPIEKGVIHAGQPENEDVLNKNLIGLKPGEVRNFLIDFDLNHKNKKLAGRTIEYTLKIVSVKEKKLPEITDEFAKDLGEFTDLNALKEKIREELVYSKEKEAKNEMAEEILKKISDQLSIELPEILVDQEYRRALKNFLSSRPQKDLKKEELEQLKTEAQQKAEQNLKNHLILTKIAEKEGLTVSDQEIHEEFKAIAKANNVPLAKVVDSVNREGKREEIQRNLQLKKTVDFLVEQAIIESQDSS